MNNMFINNALSDPEQELLAYKNVLVVGLGGLGGIVLEELVRIGVGNITICDGDRFSDSNINRQLLATTSNINELKVMEAFSRAKQINPNVNIEIINNFLANDNADYLVSNKDLIIDCLDNIESRLLLNKTASKYQIPLVHGAINASIGQISTIINNYNLLPLLYEKEQVRKITLSLVYVVNTVASIQVAEAIKVLLNKEPIYKDKLLMIDFEIMEFTTINSL